MQTLKLIALAGWLTAALGCAAQQSPAVVPASSFDSETYKGKILLLNFWTTWCSPCRYEIPDLVKIRNSFDPEEVAIVGISLDRDPPEVIRPILEKFIERYKINYLIVLDRKGELAQQYSAGSMVPMTFIIDQQGQVYKTHVGLPRDSMGRLNPLKVYAEDIQALLDRT